MGRVLSSTPDRAAADDHGPVPDLGEVRRRSVGPHRLVGQSHDGRDDWFASGGDEDVVCADLAIGNGVSARAGERGAALDDGDALVLVAVTWAGRRGNGPGSRGNRADRPSPGPGW